MAHIPDGVLSAPVLAGGAALAAVGVAAGLRALDEARLPAAALLSAAFFALSLVMIPLGPTSVHLLLSALMGLTIGVAAFPAVLVGLGLQLALFGAGGLTTLGVNTLIIAGPGWIAGALARPAVARGPAGRAAAAGALAGGGAVLLTTAAVAAALALSDPAYRGAAALVGLANLPLLAAEAAVTGFAVGFLRRVRPETFAAAPGWRAA
jgi:cobalt/nickel transport system permease protein